MKDINQLDILLDALSEHVFVLSESGQYINVFGGSENGRIEDSKAHIGKMLDDVFPEKMASLFLSYITQTLKAQQIQKVIYVFTKEELGDRYPGPPGTKETWFEGIIKPLPLTANNERTVLWTAKNITEQRNLEQRLKTLSEIDELTHIANRRTIVEWVTSAIKEFKEFGRTFTLLMFDIDKFKRINDTLGHPMGDRVIRYVANVARNELRARDCIGRLGGDEFLVLLRDTDIVNAMAVSEKLRRRIEENPCPMVDYDVTMTISIGMAEVKIDDNKAIALISRADKALYYAKNHGRNKTCCYSAEMEEGEGIKSQRWITRSRARRERKERSRIKL
ncbi:sensor domain-containing diguanylate cyclase [Vibrio porteresiae]|uniref:diguanylate cyclase n=1 Tax=Vibrio porteresiae DSM 19223 TaxID=1123496 RepID=A0ABZ0QJY5_9VIBR|nr:GGDEF domain-containing protein [Vibrio porteresiae]WPC75785.1 GGDEF domain-containing protein [Vibrio porteresiae DSM 19223]